MKNKNKLKLINISDETGIQAMRTMQTSDVVLRFMQRHIFSSTKGFSDPTDTLVIDSYNEKHTQEKRVGTFQNLGPFCV